MIYLHVDYVQIGVTVMTGREGRGFPRVIRGSVVVQRRRCGKANCRCAGGVALHESTVLSYFRGGRNRTLMLAPDEVGRVHASVARYRAEQTRLEQRGDAGLDELLTRRAAARRVR